MSGMASVIEQILLAAVTNEKARMPRRNRTDWVVTALSVLFAGGGSFLLILALDRYLAGIYAPYVAALLCAGALFAAALTALGLSHCCRSRRPMPEDSTRDIFAKNIASLIEDAFVELEQPIQESPKTAMLLSAVAGFFMASQMNAR
jgi:hypothetical protein